MAYPKQISMLQSLLENLQLLEIPNRSSFIEREINKFLVNEDLTSILSPTFKRNDSFDLSFSSQLLDIYDSLRESPYANSFDDSIFAKIWNLGREKYFREHRVIRKIIATLSRSRNSYKLNPLIESNYLSTEQQIELIEKIQNITKELIKTKRIVIEGCPTSNVFIEIFEDYKSHPIVKFKDEVKEGELLFTVNTDDPLIFDTNLLEEFLLINEALPEKDRESVIKTLIKNAKAARFSKEN